MVHNKADALRNALSQLREALDQPQEVIELNPQGLIQCVHDWLMEEAIIRTTNMHLVPIDEVVVVEGRYRRVFDPVKVAELVESIKRLGLIQLPVCREEGFDLVLVAGERRMRAIQELYKQGLTFTYMGEPVPFGNFPFALNVDLPENMAREVELDENLRRVDLSWQEVAAATAMLHKIRSEEYSAWTKGATASALKDITGQQINQTKVSNRILLAEQGPRFESVQKAKTEEEAFRTLTRELEQEFLSAMGRKSTASANTGNHQIFHGDALVILPSIPSESIDVILTDPPYGIGADTFGFDSHVVMSQTHSYSDNWDKVVYPMMTKTFPELFRVAKRQAHLYMFCDINNFVALSHIAMNSGWRPWPRPLIWHKTEGNAPAPQYGPRYMYETILYANKGNRPTISLMGDVLPYANVSTKLHAAQKPVPVYVDLLSRSVIPGNTVLDPFAGSGTIFEAAEHLNCKAIGIEMDDAAFATAKQRMETL